MDKDRGIQSVLCSFQIMIEISEARTQAVKSKFYPIAMVGSDVLFYFLIQYILEYI